MKKRQIVKETLYQGVKPRNYGSTSSNPNAAIIPSVTPAAAVADNNIQPKTTADKSVNQEGILERFNLGL